jgi:hypothetical protein
MVLLSAVAGCASSGADGGGSESPEPASAIARIHKSRCGNCHRRVEPGQRTRDEFEMALSRHHRRVHLTDEQWKEMVDYLSAAPTSPGVTALTAGSTAAH